MKSRTLGLAAALVVLSGGGAAAQTYDILIRGGLVFDGSDAPPRRADVGIRQDRVVFVGAAQSGAKADVEVSAEGKWVVPGFIDPHTHYLADISSRDAQRRRVEAALMQGVTTVFVGNDGTSASAGVGDLFRRIDQRGVGPNVASYIGFGTIRRAAMGQADRAPDAAEMARMATFAAQAMCEGALGLSTGLFYAPQSYATTEEVVALARTVAAHGGLYDTHLRDESSYGIGLAAAVGEALDIGRKAGVPVHIAHIKALGVDVHGAAPAVIAQIEAAQAGGLTVHADQYPWDASGTGLGAALLPRWAQADGDEALLARLSDAEQMARIRPAMEDNLRRRGGPDAILLTAGALDEVRGKTLAQAATHWGVDPVEAALRQLRAGGSSIASFNQVETDIRAFMARPWVVTASDASAGHPRRAASFARLYDRYVREGEVLSAQAFVHRSSGRTAALFGLEGRGRIGEGAYADVAVIDPDSYAPRATYLDPDALATGVSHVVVNGRMAVSESRVTGDLAGRPLRRTSQAPCP